jgi:hypothetical protein
MTEFNKLKSMNAITSQKEENVFKTKSWIFQIGLVSSAILLFIGLDRSNGDSFMVAFGLLTLVLTLNTESSRKIEILKQLLKENAQPIS